LDGNDIQTLNLRWLRQQISYVEQEPALFNTTIFENILYGIPDSQTYLSKNELTALVTGACIQAEVHEFIKSLPEQYETEVGERGVKLSGGQRQRIALARAFIRDVPILLLDEATSALDSKTERAIKKFLASKVRRRTTLVIAHRLSTVRNADNIVVMSRGRILQQGRHDELVQQNGPYLKMIEEQMLTGHEHIVEPAAENKLEGGGIHSDRKMEMITSTVAAREAGEPSALDGDGDAPDATSKPRVRLVSLAQMVGRLTRPEWAITLAGLCCATIAGFGPPVYVLPLTFTAHLSLTH
jgi:ATP-binding cassette subfamily B (MDR/TAP) protein 1